MTEIQNSKPDLYMISKKEPFNSLKMSGFLLKHYRRLLQILKMVNNWLKLPVQWVQIIGKRTKH